MATTINAYSVGLSLNATDYIRNSELSREETAKLTRAINQARTPAENHARSVELLNKALEKGAIDLRTYNTLLARKKVATEKATVSMGRLSSVIATIGVGRIVSDSVKLQVELEQASAKFEVLTGSAENAERMLAGMRSLAASSPITFRGMQEAGAILSQFGVRASQVLPTLRMLNDLSAGNEERMKSLALAFGQMTAAGRLMGQDLLQMVNAGFNPLQEISKMTGESMIELKKRMEDGAIATAEVVAAFEHATGAGGRFEGMSDRISRTLGGKLAIATSQLQEAMTKLGEALAPLIIQFTDGFSKSQGILSGILTIVEKIADGWGFILAVVKDFFSIVEAGLSGDYEGTRQWNSVNQFLDSLEQRQREREAAAQKAAQDLGEITDLEGQVAKQKTYFDALQTGFAGVLEKGRDVYSQLDDYAKELEEERRKQNDKLAQKALANAQQYFENERQKQMRMATDVVAKMSGAGAALGSSDAVQRQARSINAALAATLSSPKPQPTDKEILAEAKRQFAELQQQTRKQEDMVATLKDILRQQKSNGFKRID